MSAQALLTLKDATMTATTGIVQILKSISFVVEQGEFVAIAGPSGSGKSSLLRLINRLNEYHSGEIVFQGKPLTDWSVRSLRQTITLATQESRLLGMSVHQALRYPLELRQHAADEIDDVVMSWARRLKIPEEWMERTAPNLSMGQRQRVAIARALICSPTLLLLDEPTSAQDVGYSEFLLDFLAQLTHSEQLTILMANHQIELMGRHVSRLLQLQTGRLIADTPASAVDWTGLRQQLIEIEAAATAEWDD